MYQIRYVSNGNDTLAQYFLLSAASRTLSLREIYKGGEDKAYETFCKMRWAETDGDPYGSL